MMCQNVYLVGHAFRLCCISLGWIGFVGEFVFFKMPPVCNVWMMGYGSCFKKLQKLTMPYEAMSKTMVQYGGDGRIRTADLLHAKQTLYQLSYIPINITNMLQKNIKSATDFMFL